ncbi:hypothetical protein HNY73_018625 [Argiope bruennichi]|uniref:Uncharacterized protein n=1 Tax=Argiope bruennichi TaxID=94029 RepID=A0A8T0EEW3_ARGBR|nr:hypothetical protein HNY73_018625 [Argiope bruennichi]
MFAASGTIFDVKSNKVHIFKRRSITASKPSNILQTFKIIQVMIYFIGINTMQDWQLKRMPFIGIICHKISKVALVFILLYILGTDVFIVITEKSSTNEVYYQAASEIFECLILFYFFWLFQKSRQDIEIVFKCLDKMRSRFPHSSNIYNWEKKLNKFLVWASIHHILYCVVYSFFVVYYTYYKEEFAAVYWLEKASLHQTFLYVHSFVVVFLKKLIISGYCDAFNLFYSLVCFVIYQICKEHLKMLNTQDGKDLENLYRVLTKNIKKIDRKLNFKVFVLFTILFFHTFKYVFDMLFEENQRYILIGLSFEFLHDFIGFLMLSFFGSSVHEVCKGVQEKVLRLDPVIYVAQPETLLKFQRLEIYMTLWDMINLRRSLLITIFEIALTYAIVVGTA